jgi:hypothetical protein
MYLKTSARVSSQCINPRLGVVVENSHLSSKTYYRGKPDATRQSLDNLKLPEPGLLNRFVLIKACSIACGKVVQAIGDVRLLHSTLTEEPILIVTRDWRFGENEFLLIRLLPTPSVTSCHETSRQDSVRSYMAANLS